MKTTQKSYAKLNLFLEVTGKRKDGYHNIETVFHEIDLYDIITVTITPCNNQQEIIVNTKNCNIFQEANIAYKTVKKFCDIFEIKDNINIDIIKNIPMGAGLGGGSSNAAKVLNILSCYYKKDSKSDIDVIFKIALSLGADVPFFLKGGTAIGKGIGEELYFINNSKIYTFLLIFPDIFMLTKNVYANLKIDLTEKQNCDRFIFNFQKGQIFEKELYFNRLETASFLLSKKLKEIKKDLEIISDTGCLMSGSGSTLFTIVSNKEESENIINFFKKKGYVYKIVNTILR